MINAISSALSGISNATSRFDRAASRIAQPEPSDLIGDRVEQITAQHAFEANLATIRTADDMVGTLINTIA